MSVFLRNLSKSPKYKRRTYAVAVGSSEMTTSIGGAAFPTVSPTASTSRKSFFDTSAAFGTTISGHALVAVFPMTKKKGRVKQCFVTVQQTLFEVHKNQKDAKNKKPAKHLIDFGDVFNVSIHNEPIQIKDDCICIMDPNTSFFVRPIDSDYDLVAWFDWILERSRECRSTKLLRPVFREEFFEAAWDVQIVKRPKLRCDYSKQQTDAQNDDLAEKRANLLGFRRLCFCGTSFMLFSIGCRPISNVDAPEPFERSAFVELPLNVVSNYGTQERYFFVRIGRSSEIGGGELWMATEHGASARSMHERISQLNLRESERRRAQGVQINLPTISSSVLKSRAHRERSQTQNQLQKTNSQLRLCGMHPESARSTFSHHSESVENCSSRKASSNSTSRANKNPNHHTSNGSLGTSNTIPTQQLEPIRAASHACRTDSISSCLHSIPEQRVVNNDEHNNTEREGHLLQEKYGERHPPDLSVKKTSIAGLLATRLGAKMSTGICGRPSTTNLIYQITAPSSPAAITAGMTFEFGGKGRCATASLANLASSNQSARNSLVSSLLGFRLTRNSNNTIANRQNMAQAQNTPAVASNAAIFSAQPSYDCAEDYMTLYDVDSSSHLQHHQQYGYSLNAPSGSVGSRMSAVSKDESRKSSSCVAPYRQFSTGSTGYSSDTQQHAKTLESIPIDYVEMGGAYHTHADAEPSFSFSEVYSYVPACSERCWTSSSGTNNNINGVHAMRCTDLITTETEAPRAYSLGSKPNQKYSCCSQSARPSSSEMNRSRQLLHPCSNNSPPNHLKKFKPGQTAKNLHKEALEANFNGRIVHKDGTLVNEGKKASVGIMGEAVLLTDDKADEMRKRAHSAGSKALIKSSLKKFNPSSAAFNNRKAVEIDDELSFIDGPNSRRNTCDANKSMCSTSTYYPHSEDHVEINFDRDESPSVSSLPSLHSRNSSFGMMSSGFRSALDSLSHEKPSARLIRQQTSTISAEVNNESLLRGGRKRSVPDIEGKNGTSINHSTGTEAVEQDRLHPHRRLTYDGSTLNFTTRSNEKRTHKHQQFHFANKLGKSPPKCITVNREPSSRQSSSSGISTSKSNESTTTTAAESSGGTRERTNGAPITPIGYHQQSATTAVEAIVERKESDEGDYVLMLNTPRREEDGAEIATATTSGRCATKKRPVQQQLSVRTIGTIVESSSSPCSSHASATSSGGVEKSPTNCRTTPFVQPENGKAKASDKNLPMTSLSLDDFPDEYQELTHISKLTDKSPSQQLNVIKSRSPSCSPVSHQGRHLPHQQLSQQECPLAARAYYPTEKTTANHQPSIRHKSEKLVGQQLRRRGHQLRSEQEKRKDRQQPKSEDVQQQHCDYAIISPSNDRK